MNHPVTLFRLLFCTSIGLSLNCPAQLTFDGNTSTAGVQNGSGDWNLTTANWWDGSQNVLWDNTGSTIASFGSSTSRTGGTITVSGTVLLGGMIFNPLSSSTVAELPLTIAHTITGGTLHFADNAVIQAANNTSSGSTGTLFINLNSVIKGNGLRVERPDEERINAFQYVRFGTANPELLGDFTVKARATNYGIFMLLVGSSTIASVDRVIVESGSVLAAGGAGNTYATPFVLAGDGQSSGAIRFDSSNMTFSGGILLQQDATVRTNSNILNTVISGAITDAGAGHGFQRLAATVNSVLTLTGISTYSGPTSFGRVSTTAGGITVLDFATAAAPVSNLLYHGLETAGGLNLNGGTYGHTVVMLQGKERTVNTQAFGDTLVAGTRSNVMLNAGLLGEMQLALGAITRSGTASVSFISNHPGAIATTTADGFIGPWATLTDIAGKGAWAGVEDGKLIAFTGGPSYVSNTPLGSMGATTHVRIDATSTGDVLSGTGTLQINTLTMADEDMNRVVTIGAGDVLRLGSVGGVQLLAGSSNLSISGNGSLRAGTATGQLWLTNLSESGTLAINTVIENNGANVLTLFVNGSGTTLLTGANTFTGATQIGSGYLEVAHNTALGTAAGNTTVLHNGGLVLSGGITMTENLILNGLGPANDGALRNRTGDNTLSGTVTVSSSARINSDAGHLIFSAATASTNSITTSTTGTPLFFGGSGDITLMGRLNSSSNTITKDGAGTLTFSGLNLFTGAITATAGTVHADFSPATSPLTNLLYNDVATPAALTLNGSTFRITGKTGETNSQTLGALTLTHYANLTAVQNGATSLNLTLGVPTRSFGALLGLDLPSSGSIRMNTGENNSILLVNSRPYAFIRDSVNGDEWAATGALSGGTRPLVKLSTTGGYTASTATTLAGNADIAAGIPTTTLAGNTSITSLRFAQAQVSTVIQSEPTELTVGGILVSSTVGNHLTTISTATLRPTPASVAINPELTIFQNNPHAPLLIQSAITNSLTSIGGAGTVSVRKAGPGLLQLGGANTFSGNLSVYEGTVQFVGGSLSSSMEFLLGSGGTSGKVILGTGTTHFSPLIDYITTVGVGTDNRIVGGSSGTTLSRLTLTGSTSTISDFSKGFLGGSGENENRMELRLASLVGLVRLGSENTYIGQTILSRGIFEVTKLANVGEVNSLGTGSFNAAAAIITVGDATTSALGSNATGVIRYVGSEDSVTNRPINLTNSGTLTTILSVTAELDNIGTGTVKFTAPFTVAGSNTNGRMLRLTGTNTGMNEVVGIGEISLANPTSVEKTGLGTWAITGSSLYTGGTNVQAGLLLVTNPSGSATGLGPVNVLSGATLGGIGRIAPAADLNITFLGGTLQVGSELYKGAAEPGKLTLVTSGTGELQLLDGSRIAMDLFSGAGLGNNTLISTAADLLVLGGGLTLGTDITLRVTNPNGMNSWGVGDQWRLFDWTSLAFTGVNGSFSHYELPDLPEDLAWHTQDLLTSGVLSITQVPEPSRTALLLLALIGVAARRRR